MEKVSLRAPLCVYESPASQEPLLFNIKGDELPKNFPYSVFSLPSPCIDPGGSSHPTLLKELQHDF